MSLNKSPITKQNLLPTQDYSMVGEFHDSILPNITKVHIGAKETAVTIGARCKT